jgi:cell division protein DivIC
MAKKVSRNVKRRMTVLVPFSFGIFLVTLFIILSYAYNIRSLELEKIRLENYLVNLKEEANNMEDEIEKLKDPEYIAKYARENYLYTKEGEYVLKIEEKKKNEEESKTPSIYPYIIIGVISIIVFSIFIKIIKKRQRKNNK